MVLPVFVTDDVPTADQVNEFMVNVRCVVKSADETVTSNSTLQDDNHLTLPVLANAVYLLEMHLFVQGPTGASQGIKYQHTLPSGAAFAGSALGHPFGSTNGTSPQYQYVTSAGTASCGTFGAGVNMTTLVHGVVTTSSTAGSMTLQWAQTTSNATSLIVRATSWMRLTRMS